MPTGLDLVPEEPRPFKSDEAGAGKRKRLVEYLFDVRLGIDRGHGQRQVLRPAQCPVGAQLAFQPEPFDAAQRDAGRYLMPGVQVD